ncbi:class I SAM-dependent methyltransferase [Methylobacterium sp. J-026]|uniref:methyltransferase domain-containing protein n=1 Tax=Methylobacterium sp. J-026 TaxID=2836624 RepID=UPI001FBB30AE|nr:methyltransferase domain-containing protein [Methylobacterium sp. J-026]MCJ2137643.1 class I SAM-dependent methyltransferase [Methylobacterium sp. J-026]
MEDIRLVQCLSRSMACIFAHTCEYTHIFQIKRSQFHSHNLSKLHAISDAYGAISVHCFVKSVIVKNQLGPHAAQGSDRDGQHAPEAAPASMPREQYLLDGLSKAGKLIEIGPAHNPLVPRSAGWNSFSLDHASRADLVAKYAGDPWVDPAKIEEVDFVWRGGLMIDAVPAEHHGTFDAVIASHVIEHTTDVIRFLQAAQTLLRPEGTLRLAVPDKRKCFDFYRNPSTTADTIVAYEDRRDRHDVRTHIDYALRMATKRGCPGWFEGDTQPAELLHRVDIAWQMLRYRGIPDYVDAHNWVFVPASFELMMLELCQLDFLDLRIENLVAMPATEFLVRVRPGREAVDPETIQARRRALMDRMLIELADQTRQIAGSPLYAPPQEPPQEPPQRPPEASPSDPAPPVRRSGLRRWLAAGASLAAASAALQRVARSTR